MDNENRNDIIPGEDTPEGINGDTPEVADIDKAVEGLNEKFENLSEEEFINRTGIVVPASEAPSADENASDSAGDDTLTIDTDAVNSALEDTDTASAVQTESNAQIPPAGQYNYSGAQFNQQFTPPYQQPPVQNNGYQQPPFYQNNAYQQGNGYQQNNGGAYQPYNGYQQNNSYQPPFNGGYNPPPKKKSSGMKVFIALIAAIVVISVVLIAVIFSGDGGRDSIAGNMGEDTTGAIQQQKPDTDNVGDIQANEGSIDAGEAVTVAQIAKPFNVGILVYKNNSLYTEGSGVIVKEDDDSKYTYIVTCAHVVNHSGVALSVLLEDGTEYQADLVGMDTRTDLAVVRIEESGLPVAEIASSEGLVVGQTVYAVGNPGGSEFFGSVTNGIISAIARPVSSSTGYEMECIQHTSAINPGNSGGALLNEYGQVIGLNSSKITDTDYEGMGFSVPSNTMLEIYNDIAKNGYVTNRPMLGISYYTVASDYTYSAIAWKNNLPYGSIVIAAMTDDSNLAKQGIKVGDIITAVNGKALDSTDLLLEAIESSNVGDTITLSVCRLNNSGAISNKFEATVKLIEDKGETAVPQQEPQTTDPFSSYFGEGFGY